MEYNHGKSAKSLGIDDVDADADVDADSDAGVEAATRRFSS